MSPLPSMDWDKSRNNSRGLNKSSRGGVRIGSATSSSQTVLATTMTTLDGMDSKMTDLRQLFGRDDPIEKRHTAAIQIGACIRGYLCRRRLSDYLVNMAEWRWGRCRHVIKCLDLMLSGDRC